MIILLKNSLVLFGCIGVYLGFVTIKVAFSHYEANEIIIADGFMKASDSADITTDHSNTSLTNGRRIKVFCMVISSLDNDGKKAKLVNNTWGKRCDKLIFITSRKSAKLNTVEIPRDFKDNRNIIWEKVKVGFSHAYANYRDFDWFLKADDDTYIVMENLKWLLSVHKPTAPMLFGCRFHDLRPSIPRFLERFRKDFERESYMSGGAGYILSRAALKDFVEIALGNNRCSEGIALAEDMRMSRCLKSINVKFMDTRDNFGRLRFFPLMPFYAGYLRPGRLQHDLWYFTRLFNFAYDGMEDASAESAISFHYVHEYFDLFEFFLYHLSPYQNKYH